MPTPRKKHPLKYNAIIYKELLSFAGTPENKEGVRDTHDDLLSAWGVCQSVFGTHAKPEHAIALLPLLQDALDEANAPATTSTEEDEDEEDDEDEDDEDDEEEELDPERREVVEMPVIDPPQRRSRRSRAREH